MQTIATLLFQNGMPFMNTPISQSDFEQVMDRTLMERSRAEVPGGFAQRMLAHVAIADEAASQSSRLFSTADRVNTTRSTRSLWTAITLHAAVFVVVFAVAAQRLHTLSKPKAESDGDAGWRLRRR